MKKQSNLSQSSLFGAFSNLPSSVVFPELYFKGVEDLYNQDYREYGLDIETEGLNYLIPYRNIISFALSRNKNTVEYSWQLNQLDNLAERDKQRLIYILQNPLNIIVGHNIKFDINWIRYKWNIDIKCQIFDTYIAASLINENREKNSLDIIIREFLDDPLLVDYKGKVDRTNLLKHHKDEILLYNGKDGDGSRQLLFPMLKKLERISMLPLSQTLFQVTKILSKMETTGVYLDQDWRKREENKLFNRIVDTRGKLQAKLGKFDPNKSNELKNVLYGQLGFREEILNEALENEDYDLEFDDSVNFDRISELKRYGKHIETLDEIIKYRKDLHNYASFYKPLDRYVKYDGRMHYTYRQGWVKTWRLSCGDSVMGLNMQQIPRDKSIKGMFAATPGYKWIGLDLSQGELRCAAQLSQEPVMIEAFNNDHDIHTAVMADLKGMEYNEVQKILSDKNHPDHFTFKTDRVAIKRINFGILFGVSAPRLRRLLYAELGIDYDIEYCQGLIDQWLDRYQAVKKYIRETQQFCIKNGFVRMPLGAVRRLPGANYQTGDGRRELRQAVNFGIQCFSGLIAQIGMILINDFFTNLPFDARMLLQTHDSIESEVKLEGTKYNINDLITEIRWIMEKGTIQYMKQVFDYNFTVPLKIDIDCSDRWS